MWFLTLACLSEPESRKPDDVDGDGAVTTVDCDDNEPAVYPGAVEVCDGLDNDCSGAADEGLGDPWYLDADGDGYGTADASISACTPSPGYVDNADDCLDEAASVHPGAVEVCDNLLDDDCDDQSGTCRETGSLDLASRAHWVDDPYGEWGVSVADAYGAVGSFTAALAVGVAPDVDDPYGVVVLFEGPFPEGATRDADLVLVGRMGDGTGQNVAWAWSDDGTGLLLAGAPDGYPPGLWIAEGPFAASVDPVEFDDVGGFVSGAVDADVGAAVAVGDLNGDGVFDPITTDPLLGLVYAFTSPASGNIQDADVILEGDVGCGQSLGLGDGTVDGLGVWLAVGCPDLGSGRVYLVEGGVSVESGSLRTSAARIDASAGSARFGHTIQFGGWYTASDLFVGAPDGDGAVFAFDGHLSATSSRDADAQLTGDAGDGLGQSLAVADVDGDGPDDLLIGGDAVPGLVVYGSLSGTFTRSGLSGGDSAAVLSGLVSPAAVAARHDNDALPLLVVSDPVVRRAEVVRLHGL